MGGVTPATVPPPEEQGGVTPAAPKVETASEAVPMEVDAGVVTRATGPPPIDKSWLPLCDERGNFFAIIEGFKGAEEWIHERDIILLPGIVTTKALWSTNGEMRPLLKDRRTREPVGAPCSRG